MSVNLPHLVLILAAGRLPDRQLGPAPLLHEHPLDLPAGSDLALQRIIQHYRERSPTSKLVAVIDRDSKWHHRCLGNLLDQLMLITPQTSVGNSLLSALDSLEPDQQILVNPITALPDEVLIPTCGVVISATSQRRENWSAFKTLAPKGPNDLLSKLDKFKLNEIPSYAFTGLLSGKCHQLKEALISLTPQQRKDLAWLAAALLQQHHAEVVLSQWRDLGHRATYARSRREHLVSRTHNKVIYDAQADLIVKTSKDQNRLQAEAFYLEHLPKALQRFFPTVVSNNIDCGIELEYIPFPSLAELFLHWEAGASGWDQIFKRLGWILDEHTNRSTPVIGSPAWLFSLKLIERIHIIDTCPPSTDWECFWSQPLEVNGSPLPSPRQCCDELIEKLRPIETDRPLHRIHGDLCFNNIMADPLHGTIRLIDPRGEQAPNQNIPLGYGDPRYELVKLLHSGVYLYDSVVNGFFTMEQRITNTTNQNQGSNAWKIKIIPPEHYELVRNLLTLMVRDRGLLHAEQRYLCASLFFSMLPLHNDSVIRQKMFTLIGCCLVTDSFSLLLPCENH